jgi:hypothetical protein
MMSVLIGQLARRDNWPDVADICGSRRADVGKSNELRWAASATTEAVSSLNSPSSHCPLLVYCVEAGVVR